VHPNAPSPSDYADHLQFIGFEDGRIRPQRLTNTSDPNGFVFDYFLKDHLGNVRMVLTEAKKLDKYPAATMEDVANVKDQNDPNNYVPFYFNTDYSTNSAVRYKVDDIGDYPTDNSNSTPNNYVVRLKGNLSSTKLGPSMVLKVMGGDQFNARASSWYKTSTSNAAPDPSQNPAFELIDGLSSGISGISGGKALYDELNNSPSLSQGVYQFFQDQ
jgi:hypothetical protein